MNAKILIVDDDPDLLKLMSDAFVRAGFETFCAKNGHEAAKIFKASRFDLVITDILMPERDGIETILEIKRGEAPPKVVAISGGGRFAGHNFLQWAKVLGADGTLIKPFKMSALVALALNLLTTLSTDPLTIPRASPVLAI